MITPEPQVPHGTSNMNDVSHLLAPKTDDELHRLMHAARVTTQQRFGKTIKLFAPLYLSNECVNVCTYCGFRRDRSIARRTLSLDEVEQEARILIARGHRHILLVAGEHPRAVNMEFLEHVAKRLKPLLAELTIEVAPLEKLQYQTLVRAGVDGVVLFQETYNRESYERFHLHGPKANFEKRLEAIDAAASSGIRSLGLGVLLGLSDWRSDICALITHARALMKSYWNVAVSISFPRLTDAVPGFEIPHAVSDRDLMQAIAAVRLALPTVECVLSTRESPSLRDFLVGMGVTRMSAGSHTAPGGYAEPKTSGEQFSLHDRRTPEEVATRLTQEGFDPVWRDHS